MPTKKPDEVVIRIEVRKGKEIVYQEILRSVEAGLQHVFHPPMPLGAGRGLLTAVDVIPTIDPGYGMVAGVDVDEAAQKAEKAVAAAKKKGGIIWDILNGGGKT